MIIKQKLKNLTTQAGVYKMLDKKNSVIYIGKAKNLKNRVSSYFNNKQSGKTRTLVVNTVDFEVLVTTTETQALILENQLIKKYLPRYNILLKDSKSYPYIFISNDKHPRIGFYRGNKNEKYHFFGPYPSASIVRDSINLLKKIFMVRTCTNSTYKSRSRACLEHQINLCSAPCVGKINEKNYLQDVGMLKLFLSGKSKEVLQQISIKMQEASKELDFEQAAKLRDRMIALRKIQENHLSINNTDIDIVSIASKDNIFALEVLFIRSGKQIGEDFILPKNTQNQNIEDVLSAFLPLYYLGKNTPKQILISHKITNKNIISQALNVQIINQTNTGKKHYLNIANLTVKEKLKQHLISKCRKKTTLENLQKILNLENIPRNIECFDISHMMGEATTASCVVFENGEAVKKKYRQFNIKNIIKGDDYGAMRQAIYRRYSRLLKNNIPLPNLVLIDGGIGQLNQAIMVLDSIGIESIKLVAVAKGDGRKAGLETLIMIENKQVKKINLKAHDTTLMLINHIRDESHRFAIINHRKKRLKKRTTSTLENIQGIGKKRSSLLLNYFGGMQEISMASIDEIKKVDGISQDLAIKIVTTFKD